MGNIMLEIQNEIDYLGAAWLGRPGINCMFAAGSPR